MKIKLKTPIHYGSEEIDDLSFREEVVAGDLRGIKVSALADLANEDLLKIAGRLCGKPESVMNALSLADTMRVYEVVGGFFATGLTTGTEPSL